MDTFKKILENDLLHVYLNLTRLYIRKSDLEKPIKEHQWVTYNGKGFYIMRLDEKNGLLEVTLEGNRE